MIWLCGFASTVSTSGKYSGTADDLQLEGSIFFLDCLDQPFILFLANNSAELLHVVSN